MKKTTKQIIVFVGVLIKDNKILLNLRDEPEAFGAHLKWELPGGKCEFNENPEEAIVREFQEETGVEVKVKKLIPLIVTHNWEYEWGIQQTFIIGYECEFIKQGKLVTDHHVRKVEWKSTHELGTLDLIAGSREIIESVLR